MEAAPPPVAAPPSAPPPGTPSGTPGGTSFATRAARALAAWLVIASGFRQLAIHSLGALPSSQQTSLKAVATLNGLATDLAAFALFVLPWLVLAHRLRARGRWTRRAGAAAPQVALGVLTMLLCFNLVALERTGSRLNFRLLAFVEEPVALLELLTKGAGGGLALAAVLLGAFSLPTLLVGAFSYLGREPLSPRLARALGVLAAVLFGYATYTHLAPPAIGSRFFALLVEDYEDPAYGLLRQALEPAHARLATPTVLSLEDRRLIREVYLGDRDAAPASPDYPLFRRWRLAGPRVLPVTAGSGPRSVVLILLEGNSADDVGAINSASRATPELDALAREGLLFTRFFSNATGSADSLFATLFSAYPSGSGFTARLGTTSARGSLPGILAGRGFKTAFIATRGYQFESLYRVTQGFAEIVKTKEAPGKSWGDDRETLRATAEWLEAARAPSFAACFTSTHHVPWEVPEERFRDPDATTELEKSRATLRYQDDVLGEFFARVRKTEAFADTLFVLVGDHGRRVTHAGRTSIGEVTEECIHVPLLLYCPKWLPAGRSDLLGSAVDVAPTVLDLLGVDDVDAVFAGRSLLRGGQGRVYTCAPYGHAHYALLRGGVKADYNSYFDRTTCYRLGTDEEIAVPPAEVEALTDEILLLNRYATWFVANGRVAPP